jgi:hypothetical protein
MTNAVRPRHRWRRRGFFVAVAALALAGVGGSDAVVVSATPSSAPTTQTKVRRPIRPAREMRLFNGKNLQGWYTFFPSKGVNSDPERIISVENDGVIRVTGKEFGYFATTDEYAGYHLSFEVKWGEKKWPPRENAVRDSGVLVHMIGPDKVWPKSWECQVQENDFGDIHHIDGISSVVNGQRRANRVIKTANHEKPHGEWNTVEVICDGDTATNIVNGHVVNVATGLNQTRDGSGPALIKGKIAFQSEGAECYYRNIVIKPIQQRR